MLRTAVRSSRNGVIKPFFARYNSTNVDYSKTIILPQTSFNNRSDDTLINDKLLPQTTKKLYGWNINRKCADINDLFIFHDGPPYANGDLHIGHALNKVLKDIINRFQLIQGKKVHYVPGWDCHGLPIELKTLEKLSKERKEQEKLIKKEIKKSKDENLKLELKKKLDLLKSTKLSSTDIIKLSTEHAMNTQKSQSDQFQQMAIMGDFENPYLTLKNSYIVDQLRIFKKFFDNGLVHRQEKPVYWGCENSTALAEGELEYNHQHESKAAYVKFPIVQINEKLRGIIGDKIINEGISALIWTSTPWTLAANLAISINEKFNYTIIFNEKFGNLIVAVDLLPELEKIIEFEKLEIEFTGDKLLNCGYKSLVLNNDKTYPFIHGDHVTSTAGTGLVHTAPGHGHDDYLVCLKNNIKPYSPVDKFGKYTNEIDENLKDFIGLKVLTDGNLKMIKLLEDVKGLVFLNEKYIHSYPYDWRSKKPIIIRATPQWFIDVSKIKDKTINALTENVNFHPKRGLNRLTSFIKNRNEWCISRQRSWGVPIPVLYHRKTGEPLLNDEIIEKIISIIEKDNILAWFEQIENGEISISKWLPEKYQHLSNDYILGTDTMDVWFDSGSSWKTIERYLNEEGLLNDAKKRGYYSDIYLEGSDQHRGWFQSSVLTKVGTLEENSEVIMPYKNIITHGFTLDEKGEKMSKSIGNTILPFQILNGDKNNNIPKIGIDGLRLWVAQSDYTNDINVGPTILKHVGDNIKKLRFTFKFLLGNISGSSFENDIDVSSLPLLERYILSRLNCFEKECFEAYNEHSYYKVVKSINQFVNVELSSIYFDIRKDALYTDSIDSEKRQFSIKVMEEITKILVSVVSPITPIIAQEVWDNMPSKLTLGEPTPFHAGWKVGNDNNEKLVKYDETIETQFKEILKLKEIINLQIANLRSQRIIGSSLETEVHISSKTIEQLQSKIGKSDLEDIFVVGRVIIDENTDDEIIVSKSTYHKCPRCWKHSVEPDSGHELCHRCQSCV